MIRQINILATGIYPKFEHLFSSKKHKIFRAYQRYTAETYLTKIIIAKDQRIFNLYKEHIVNNILPYLVSIKYLNHSSLMSLQQEFGQAMVKTQYEQENEQSYDYEGNENADNNQTLVRKQKDSVTIILSKKMIKGVTLRQMILNKDERLNEEFCFDLIAQIVDFLLMGNGMRDMFITTQNIIVEDTGLIHFNYFSFVGLQFIKQDKYITKVQFEQILPYLTPNLMKNKNQIDLQVELRFILINFLSAYFKKDIIFGVGHFNLEVQVKRDKVLLGVVSKVTDSLLLNILSPTEKNKLQNHRTRIAILWDQCLNQKKKTNKQEQVKQPQNKQLQSKQTFNWTWQFILQNLTTYQPKPEVSESQEFNQNNNEEMNGQNKQTINKQCKIKIKSFIDKLNINEKNNCVFIASVLHNIVDIFIDIVDNIMQDAESKELKLKNIAKIQKFKDTLVNQRNDLIKRSRYSKSVYIPIKTGMRFSSILKYKNWIMMLQQSDCANQATIQAVINLIKFILDIRQTMSDIGMHISSNLIQKITQNKRKKKNIQVKSQVDQELPLYNLLAGLSKSQNLRKWFWQIFFIVTNKILLLVKKFYLRATAYHFAEKIKINQEDFSQILQNFTEFIPPLHPVAQPKVPKQNSSPKKSSQHISDV